MRRELSASQCLAEAFVGAGSQGLGMNDVLAYAPNWFFDVQQGLVHLTEPVPNQAHRMNIFNTSGQMVQRIKLEGKSTAVELPAGMYVAQCEGRAPLKFVAAAR